MQCIARGIRILRFWKCILLKKWDFLMIQVRSLIFRLLLNQSGEEIRNDLLRYTNELYERRRGASFLCEETEYYQITLLDLFQK